MMTGAPFYTRKTNAPQFGAEVKEAERTSLARGHLEMFIGASATMWKNLEGLALSGKKSVTKDRRLSHSIPTKGPE